jgi:hypothetical protein
MQGHLLYVWGALGDYPDGLFNIHGASVDQEGSLYVAEVANGRVQKFRPWPGLNPEFLVGLCGVEIGVMISFLPARLSLSCSTLAVVLSFSGSARDTYRLDAERL